MEIEKDLCIRCASAVKTIVIFFTFEEGGVDWCESF